MDWELQDAKSQYDIIERHGCDCIVMEPVRGGALATLCDESAAVFKAAEPDRRVLTAEKLSFEHYREWHRTEVEELT